MTPTGPPLEGMPHGRWHPETLVCSFRGHVAPAAFVRVVDDDDALIALAIRDSGHFARCLRCDAWILADPANAAAERLADPPLSSITFPRRGKDLSDAIVLRAIAIDRGFHAVVFGLIAVALFVIEARLPAVRGEAAKLLLQAQRGLESTGQDASRSFLVRELIKVTHLQQSGLRLLLATATMYAVVEAVEAVGLWRQRRWAEYLTAVATAGFLPLEIHELSKRVTVTRVFALVINLAVLAYLVWAKHLFGLRGGEKEDVAELLAAERLPVLPGQPVPGP